MERINGYIDLNEYFHRTTKLDDISTTNLEEKKIIVTANAGSSALFWFNYCGLKTLYKSNDDDYSCISELVSERLCKILGIPTAEYDLATYDDSNGVITFNFKKKGYKYVDMFDVLDFHDDYYKKKNGKAYCSVNSLEDIWHALEVYLLAKIKVPADKAPDLVEKLMRQITDRFILQLISGHFDMHSGNIEIEIAPGGTDVNLVPMYDNEDMFKLAGTINYYGVDTPELFVEQKDYYDELDNYTILEKYLRLSSQEFIDRFNELLRCLDDTTIDIILEDIAKKTGMHIPEYLEFLRERFNYNLQRLKEILAKQSKCL